MHDKTNNIITNIIILQRSTQNKNLLSSKYYRVSSMRSEVMTYDCYEFMTVTSDHESQIYNNSIIILYLYRELK